jgi:haloacetate dehalogenase
MPVLLLWGENGVMQQCFAPLQEWERVAQDVRGGSLPCGHYIPEQVPDELLARVLPFFAEPN